MALGTHSRDFHDYESEQNPPKKPGLVARERQLRSAEAGENRAFIQATSQPGAPILGVPYLDNASSTNEAMKAPRAATAKAKAALRRQQNVAQGKPGLDE